MKILATILTAACVLTAGFSMTAAAADFPQRPVTVVVPWGAGGGSDIIARALAKPLEKELGKPVIITNKPGGSGTVGTSYVAHARPDGYTVGLINNTGLIHQIHYGGLDYTKADLDPLALLSFSEGDCTGSLGWPYRVHRTADTTCSVVVCTSRREGMGLLRSPLHEAVLRRHFTNHKHPLYALDRRTG